MTTGYSLSSYGGMITDPPRMTAYTQALRQAVTPGCTVIDLGAGPGLFALLAAQLGAGRVYAVEPDPSVQMLAAFAQANGLADRITIVPHLSTGFTPDAPVDVLISDIRGTLPLFEHHIPTIVDARQRLLRPGGVQLPQRDWMRLAFVSYPKGQESIVVPWERNDWGLDLTAVQPFLLNTMSKVYLEPDALMSPVGTLAELDYRSRTDPNLRASVTLTAQRAGVSEGLLLWFDAEVAPGLTYSNAPGQPKSVYGQTFLPFERPRHLAEGDAIRAEIRADLVQGDYVWSWNTWRIAAGQDAPVDPMAQSTFRATPLFAQELARRSDRHVPQVRPDQDVDRAILAAIDGTVTQGQIAASIRKAFPGQFATAQAALDRVVAVTGRYRQGGADQLGSAP